MATCFEIIEDLRPFDLARFGQRSQLDDDLFITNKVGSIRSPKLSSFVKHGHLCLRAEWDLSVGKFKFESLLIKEAQESRTREQRRPFWVTDSLERAPFVVVRRSDSVDGLIPIGVRGSMRNQRFGAYLAGNGISSRIGDDLQ